MCAETIGKKCKTCKWHDDFSWVCSNEESPNVADFTDDEDLCWLWEEKDGFKNSK